jgi:hypothetical protein
MAFAGTAGDVLGAVPVLNIQGGGYVVVGLLVWLLVRPAVRARQAAAPPAERAPAVSTTG